jgi:hypothetical protein
VVSIEAFDFVKKHKNIFSKGVGYKSPVIKRFMHFKNKCITYYSINLLGGAIGLEFKVEDVKMGI